MDQKPAPPPWERFDRELHEAAIETLERKILDLALERTRARHGAILLVDDATSGLRLDFHVVDGVAMPLGDLVLRRRRDGRSNGIAFWVADHNRTYRTGDTSKDPNYAKYFYDALSIAAVPIPWQRRAIGVLSVSSPDREAFDEKDVDDLWAVAGSAAKFLRRAQLFRAKRREGGRDVLLKGLSPEWLEVERVLEQVAPTPAPVLVRGESGTGKELVAQAIHFNSARAQKPFVVVNCAAIPEALLESTLFGHVRGAFTGALQARVGEFQKAHTGTLFLDEVGELGPALQAKLLRAVEQGEVSPLGSNEPPARVDVRVIAATNRDLEAMMRRGEFRQDLFYRLGVVVLQLPPLRSFKHNLQILVRVFVEQANRRYGREVVGASPEAMAALEAHDFPGNLRELRNVIDRAVLLASGDTIGPGDLPASLGVGQAAPAQAPAPPKKRLRALREEWLAPLERRFLEDLLRETDGRIRPAARRAGLSPATFYRLLRRRGVHLARRVVE